MQITSLLLIAAVLGFQSDNQNSSDKRAPRKFELQYGAVISELPDDAMVRVWFPIPESNELQTIKKTDSQAPAPIATAKDKKHGNAIGYFEKAQAKEIKFNVTYQVDRKEAYPGSMPGKLSEQEIAKFLSANQLVPTSGEPTKLLSDKKLATDPMQLGQELYEIVEAYMSYDKSKPGYGNGDVLWACSSKTGNCTGFHSLFISLARNQNLPARFEIGFPIGEKPSGNIKGYHCWAWFYTKTNGWIAVDISEADKHPELKEYYFGRLTPDRVAFSTGRDIELVPKPDSKPLNYFVYPHVEVDGKVWPREKIKLQLSYKDIQ